VLLKDC